MNPPADRRRVTPGIVVRSALFFILYNLAGILHSIFCVIIGPFLPFERRYRFVNLWTVFAMGLLRRLNGVRVHVEGRENLPAGGAVVLSNHQSSWETFFLQILISPQATVLKRELLWLPFFGWGLALLNPIRIDRGKGRAALKAVLSQGADRLGRGIPVVIYPEGSRQSPGTLGHFNHGGALLACRNRVPVVAMVHNSGDCWPARSWLRFPGDIVLRVSPPINTTDKDAKTVTRLAEEWITYHYPGHLNKNTKP
ncbi:lysophospholipid acyltransferase family protein [Alloalcanivorax profundimaris]|uniref:lysophospholipid acyltransferase family protein n=1 Tax=Alloalcanivorax profundimaris TaxID=2735259 RepID=UPI000C60C2B7|nr:lysophospholipid acyltransferase family protein [Alloalcanivorax profundimaris]MAO58387.1 1-acyl-sn-glycerol-3-phosphate acyltransferase [Alcanivorax sp.]MAY10688.1 1-acyl-sn-glycerol-3-phosphate acyltransferase [Alcanivorax sp.]MBF1803246.1 1-acyl-sn-glycerol-3-phosphate acyltransferase [Alloalcanivorax profundimaris]MBI53760.1 1-acyl-sn-glycerol-3-phosphate acyltransferase [Alcanivorax sp.]MBU59109.1 1-acyl-sn-glycerol-3-phosphate acyltransferase [Alcanivorax sp.]|tara:strand:+ start:354 stop:1115 length:762 start_codon:yes stop_codon:yes gene_type:complete